jgi:hypothetical protein
MPPSDVTPAPAGVAAPGGTPPGARGTTANAAPARAGGGVGWLAVLAVIGVLQFGGGLHAGYFADDFLFVHRGPPRVIEHFTRSAETTHWYRPIEAVLLSQIQARAGLETWPIHALALAAHVALAWLVWAGLRRLGFTVAQACGGSLIMLVSQAAVAAVLGNDTLSQVLGTFFGTLAVYACWRSYAGTARGGIDRGWWSLTLVALLAALFCKEAAVAFVPAVLLVIAIMEIRDRRGVAISSPLSPWLRVMPVLIITGAYLAARRSAGSVAADLGASGYYGFHIGSNVPVHLAMLLGMPLLGGSSVKLLDAARARDVAAVAVPIAVSAAFALVALWGAWIMPRRGRLFALAALALIAALPMAPLRHVSELYAYNALPFIAAFLGAAEGEVVRAGPRWLRTLTVLLVSTAWITAQSMAVLEKTAMMRDNGRAAAALLPQAIAAVRALPQGDTLWVARTGDPRRDYSVFRVTGADVLRGGEDLIRERAGRPDADVEFVQPDDAYILLQRGEHMLAVSDGRLVPYEPR